MVAGKVSKKAKVVRARGVVPAALPPGRRHGGRTAAYPVEIRQTAIAVADNGGDDAAGIQASRAQGQFPVPRTVDRHRKRLQATGSLEPMKRTGNKRSSILKGYDLLCLSLYLRAYPTSTLSERQVFIWNVFGRFRQTPLIYSEKQLCEAEQSLGISRKKCAVSDVRAFSPRVTRLRWAFWNLPPPMGIAGVPRSAMIDLDEAVIDVETCANRRMAKAALNRREPRVAGHGRQNSHLIIAAISGNEDGDRFMEIHDRSGTSFPVFYDFMTNLLNHVGPGVPGNVRCFMMDNLNIHHDDIVKGMIVAAGHMYVYRAPYWPSDGPVEYFFNALEGSLRNKMFSIDGRHSVPTQIVNFARGVNSTENYFEHVGFR